MPYINIYTQALTNILRIFVHVFIHFHFPKTEYHNGNLEPFAEITEIEKKKKKDTN